MLLWSIYQFETRESLKVTNIVILGEMVMVWYSRGSVDEILEHREGAEHPFGEKLEVAVTDGIEKVDEEWVEVYPHHRHPSQRPCADDGDSKYHCIQNVLCKRMHTPCQNPCLLLISHHNLC